jgi:hypothetical protein
MKKLLFGVSTAVGGWLTSAAYAIDTGAVSTAVDGAKTDALTVGEAVIAAVAGLVVIGLIINIVKKL